MANYSRFNSWLRAQLAKYTETIVGGTASAIQGMAALIPEVTYSEQGQSIVISHRYGGGGNN